MRAVPQDEVADSVSAPVSASGRAGISGATALGQHGLRSRDTIGQYLAPSKFHMPVRRYVSPETFEAWRDEGMRLGFKDVVAGPLVRSSYHADQVGRSAGR
ncbi:hypothetical protein PBS_53540 [Paraburkholderia sp. 2C]